MFIVNNNSDKRAKKIKKLKARKKYIVKVRGVKRVDGDNYYGKRSKSKTVENIIRK